MQIIVVFRVENDHFPPKTLYIWLFTGKHPLAVPYAPNNRHRVQQTTYTVVVGHRERPGGVLDRISAPQNWLLELIPSKTLYNSGLGLIEANCRFWNSGSACTPQHGVRCSKPSQHFEHRPGTDFASSNQHGISSTDHLS